MITNYRIFFKRIENPVKTFIQLLIYIMNASQRFFSILINFINI